MPELRKLLGIANNSLQEFIKEDDFDIEISVLKGGLKTIEEFKPRIIIEAQGIGYYKRMLKNQIDLFHAWNISNLKNLKSYMESADGIIQV